MGNLVQKGLLDAGQVEAERAPGPVAGDSPRPRQPADVGRVDTEGARHSGSVPKAGVLWVEGIPLIRSIGPGGWDEGWAGLAVGAHESAPWGLTARVVPMMPV